MTPSSLAGMTMGARKRAARLKLIHQHEERRPAARRWLLVNFANLWLKFSADTLEPNALYAEVFASYRIGQRLRPCPGCEKCTDSARLLVLGWTRRIGGSAKMTRIYSRWHKRAEYLLMIYRPGPKWDPAAGGGVTKAEAWKTMADCLRDHDQLKVFCDGSGALPAKGKVRR